MKRRLALLLIGALLSPFWLAAPVVFFVAVLIGREAYAKDVLTAVDKLGAATFGWGHRYTISAWCGADKKSCRFCRWACAIVGALDDNHCPDAAKSEELQ